MESIDLNTLSVNLREIYEAIHTEESELPLVACSHRLYYKYSWWGKTLTTYQYYRQTAEQQASNVEKTLIYTVNQLFDQAVRQIYATYQHYVLQQIRQIGTHVDPSSYENYIRSSLGLISNENVSFYTNHLTDSSLVPMKKVREWIKSFSEATWNFWNLTLKHPEKIRKLPIQSTSALLNPMFQRALTKAQAIFKIEAVTQEDIPLPLLFKLLSSQSLTEKEKWQMKRWITKLQDVSVDDLEQALIEIFHMCRVQKKDLMNVAALAVQLEELGCCIFRLPSPLHIPWFRKLSMNNSIVINGTTYVLAKELPSQKKAWEDQTRVFEIQGIDDKVLKIAHNTFQLKIEKMRIKMQEHRLQSTIVTAWHVPIFEVDEETGCALVERQLATLDRMKWNSPLSATDKKIIDYINQCLMAYGKKNQMPSILSPTAWGVDQQGRIKCLQHVTLEKFNYVRLEEFCHQISHHRLDVLEALMVDFKEHIVARYFKNAVVKTLKEGQINKLTQNLPEDYDDQIYRSHIEKLCQTAFDELEECFKAVSYSYQTSSLSLPESLKQHVAEALADVYQNSPTPGCFSLHFKENVLDQFKTGSWRNHVSLSQWSLMGAVTFAITILTNNQ